MNEQQKPTQESFLNVIDGLFHLFKADFPSSSKRGSQDFKKLRDVNLYWPGYLEELWDYRHYEHTYC